MMGFQRHFDVEEFLRQTLEQDAGDQAVQIALVGKDDLRLWQ